MITGGKSYVTSAPAFSNDRKRLLVCTGSTVSVFSTATALQVSELEGHTALVTSVVVLPVSNPSHKILSYCWTSSLDGTIRYWDFSVPEMLKKINFKLPIFSMVIPPIREQSAQNNEKSTDLFAYVSVEAWTTKKTREGESKALHRQVQKFNLTKSRVAGGMTLAETHKPEQLIISPSGNFFGIKHKKKLQLWQVPPKDSDRAVIRKIKLHHTKHLTTLAFHPSERIVVAGDVTGRILIWKDIGNRTFSERDRLMDGSTKHEDERPCVREDDDADSCSTWHWHSSEVNVLSFSSDGAYLYSGGREGVLVIWQLETGKKKFLPRIGSPLLYYIDSPDPSLAVISCSDNQIHLLKMPSMEVIKSITGIKRPCLSPEIYEGLRTGLGFDKRAGFVALRTQNYCVQLYSLLDNREVSEVQVCERNHQPGDDVTVVVTLVVVSLDGSTMCTADVKLSEEGIGGLVCLRFWASGSQSREFILSTIIYEPHRDAGISAIAFHPSRHMAVSSSYGGDFKIWVSNHGLQQDNQTVQNIAWTCHAVGSYKKKPMTAAAFSNDGSVLAVAAETYITLWNPDKNVLVAVIGETLTPIVSLSFVGNSEYLVSASGGSNSQLCIWDMSQLSASWSYKLHAEAIACTTDSSSFAVLVLLPTSSNNMESNKNAVCERDGAIFLFNVQTPVPIATWSVRKARGGGLAFLEIDDRSDVSQSSVMLAYINGDHEYVLFDPYGKETSKVSIIRRERTAGTEETGLYGYSSIYGELHEFVPKRDQSPPVTFGPSERPWETIFSGSSHSLPPLTKLCSSFLESLLEKRSVVVE